MSNQPIVPVSVPYAEPTLSDLLDAHAQSIFLNFNCHAVATVESFTAQDSATGYAKLTATMNYTQTFLVQQQDGSYVHQQRAYPALVDCPVIVLGGGPVSLQMPIAAGDQCLILFNDRDLNNWWAGAQTGPVASARLHSFSDAMALVGFSKWKTGDQGVLTNGNAKIGVAPAAGDGHVILSNSTTSLYTCLSNLITAIEGMTMSAGTLVCNGAAVTGVTGSVVSTTALENARNALQGLLE